MLCAERVTAHSILGGYPFDNSFLYNGDGNFRVTANDADYSLAFFPGEIGCQGQCNSIAACFVISITQSTGFFQLWFLPLLLPQRARDLAR